MIDPRLLRDDPERIRQSLRRRGSDIDLDELISLEEQARAVQARAEQARASQKEAGREIAGLSGEDKERAIAEVSSLADEVKRLTSEADELRERFETMWLTVPNLVNPTAAEGLTEEDAEVMREVGERPDFGFEASDHATLGSALGLVDTERAAKVSGSRFGYLKGQAVLLEFALVRWAFDHLVRAGHLPMVPPVRRGCLSACLDPFARI
ncbi:MAG: hypothetical protein ACLFWM_14315 [Actinomycetota bacterium]